MVSFFGSKIDNQFMLLKKLENNIFIIIRAEFLKAKGAFGFAKMLIH